MWLVLPLLLITGLVIAVYVLRIEQVRVTGLETLSARDIVRASGLELGERILWVRLSAAEHAVERIPAVADAVAERTLPSTVVIHVRERLPLARLDTARDLVVDRHGVIFPVREHDVPAVLYGWKGKKTEGARVDQRSRKMLAALPGFPKTLRERVRKIVVAPSFVVTLEGGTQVRFGSSSDLDAKADVAAAVLAAEKGRPLEYVDVRSPSVPVSKRRATPSPSPTAAPVEPAASPAPLATPTPAPPATPVAASSPTPAATPARTP
jgi:cell division septal protein FtsQ